MILQIAVWILIAFLLYTLLPEVIFHHLGVGVRRRADVITPLVALTFDDGPGESTEAILDLLRSHGARATFFLLGEKARSDPDKVRMIRELGHEIANHGDRHKAAWILGPVSTFQQIDEGALTTAALTGKRSVLYRPPWGQFNAFTLWAAKRSGQTVTLWNVNPQDWAPRVSAEGIAERIVKGAHPGNIILLHDAGGDGRSRTVQALAQALPTLVARGVRLVTVSELFKNALPSRSLAQDLWNTWEAIFDRLYDVDDLGENALFRINRGIYKGGDISLHDGRVLTKGTLFAEVHFKNDRLGRLGPIRGLRDFKNSMELLARYIQDHKKYGDIEFFMGTTVLARPAEALGFHAVDLPPGLGRWWAKLYRYWLLLIYHPEGGHRLASRQRLEVRLTYITRQELLSRYGTDKPSGIDSPGR